MHGQVLGNFFYAMSAEMAHTGFWTPKDKLDFANFDPSMDIA